MQDLRLRMLRAEVHRFGQGPHEDEIVVADHGHRRVVALMGSMLSAAQEELIVRTAGPGGRVILLFDQDEAGRKGSAETRDRLSQLLDVRSVALAGESRQPDSLEPERLIALLNQ